MKIIVTGAKGLVGRAVIECCRAGGERVVTFDHHSLDITDEVNLDLAFQRERPDVLINCAAWTDVDGCELDPERAQNANSRGPELLALACRKACAQLITISTDYVFDGKKDGFYTQRDQPNPQSIYGASKLEGERRALNAWANTIVVRSGYIFGAGGTNFLSTLVARARRGENVTAISDSWGTPTYAPHLARQMYRLCQINVPGIYHVVNSGDGASFADFAQCALEVAGLPESLLEKISVDSLKRPAPRPRQSRLRCLLSRPLGLEPLPSLPEAVSEFIAADSAHRLAEAGSGSI